MPKSSSYHLLQDIYVQYTLEAKKDLCLFFFEKETAGK